MNNEKHINGLINEAKRRLEIINNELNYLQHESKKKYCLNDPEILLKVKSEYDQYSKEFELLTNLENFYSETV